MENLKKNQSNRNLRNKKFLKSNRTIVPAEWNK
jgi:hypothetical protein